MFLIERRTYGLWLTFSGAVPAEEMERWVEASRLALADTAPGFGLVVDMRALRTLSPEARRVLESGQLRYRQAGMVRSAVVFRSAVVALQLRAIAQGSGIRAWERYVDAATHPDWLEQAERWVTSGLEPRKAPRPWRAAARPPGRRSPAGPAGSTRGGP